MTSTSDLSISATQASFLRYLSTGQDPDGFVSPAVVAELTFPHVTFHLDGKADLDVSRDRVSDDEPWEMEVHEVVPTADGFVVVAGITTRFGDGGSMRAHTVTLVRLEEGRMVGMRHWCSGAL